MLETKQASPLHHLSKTFLGVRFLLLGFQPNNRFQVQSKLVDGGGVDVGLYCPNCTHVIVDKLLYDDPVCVAARSDGKILVTSLWVDHSFDVGIPVDHTNVMYRPLKDLTGIPGAKSLNVCLTGYQRQDRDDIMTMVSLMGANFSKPLIANKVTHLICYKFEGEKYELAKKMQKIKLVNHRWLEDCLKAWEILPEANYNQSTYELELIEAEAKDSEEETEAKVEVSKKCGNESAIPRQNQIAKVEVSRNLSDSSASKGLLNVENTVDKSSLAGKQTTSDQVPNVHKLNNQRHEVLGTLRDVTLSEQSKQYDRIGTPLRIGNGLVSPLTTAKRSPHSDAAAKSGLVSYTRKTPRRTTSPILPGEMSSNLLSTSPVMNIAKCEVSEGFNISSFTTEQTNIGSGFSEVKTPTEVTDVLPEEGRSGTLSEKRKTDISSGSSEIQNTGHNPEVSIPEASTVANRRSEMFETASKIDVCVKINNRLSPNSYTHCSNETAAFNPAPSSRSNVSTRTLASFDRKSYTPISKSFSSEMKVVDDVAKEFETSFPGPENDNLTSKSDKPDACMSNAKVGIGEASEPQSKMPGIGVSSPTTMKSDTEKSNSSATIGLVKRGSTDKNSKPVRSKMLAKKFLGSRKKSGKGSCGSQKGSIYLNKEATSHNDTVTCSIGQEEAAEYNSADSEKVETKDAQQSGNEADNKSEFMDDETEAPEDKAENESEAAVVGEKDARIEPEEKLEEDVQHLRNNKEDIMAGVDEHQMEIGGQIDKIEQKTAACGKKSEVGELSHVENASIGKKTKGTKRTSGKTKETIGPSVTKTTNTNGAANKEVISERNNENIQGRNKESKTPNLAVKRKGTKSANKMQNHLELGKENRPMDSGDMDVSCGTKGVEKLTCSKIDSKAEDESNVQPNIVERALKKDPVWFILTGHTLQRKEFQQVIRRLKGRVCRVSHHWSYQATHFIVPDPIRRTEKFFAAAASGRWILKTDYLSDSNQAGRFLAEEPYEWHKNGLSEDGAINLEAPRKWRLLRERTGHGAFHGMRIIIYGDCIAPPLDTLKRVIKAGDGTILATSPPYSRFLESGVDFAIVSPGMPHVDMWVQEFIRHEIPCVVADYLVEYVCKPGYSLERHVQYNTHAWAEKSLKNLVNRLDEIVEEVTPHKENVEEVAPQRGGSDEENTACQVCGSHERGEVMLICGDESGSTGCGVGTHINCCDPPLECVPEEDWFCPKCSSVGKNPPKRPRKTTSVSRKK